MNHWKVSTFVLALLLLTVVYSGHITSAQAHRKAHITAVGLQGVSSTSHLPYLEDIDGKDVDVPGDVKGFSCIPAKGVKFNGEEKLVPQCYIVSQ
jgi:bacteriorhodopsin